MSSGLWSCLVPCGYFWCDSSKTTGGLRMTDSSTTEMGATVSSTTTTGDFINNSGSNSGIHHNNIIGNNNNNHHHHHHQNISTTTIVTPATSATTATSTAVGSVCVFIREQRRKKVTGFATLRKKFIIRRRRSSKTCDHGRVLREFVSDWNPIELAALHEEYEALAALKDLSVQAELARPPATTFKQDLSALYDYKHCTDCDLVFHGTVFPVHRALLSARCPYFRELLGGCPGFGARICLELRASPVDVALFSSLLRYLYTGDLCSYDPTIDLKILRRLGDEFGTPNQLEHDLRYLLETGDYADAALVFTSDNGGGGGGGGSSMDFHRPDSGSSEYGFRPKLELPCHKAILSARSPFFRNLIQRRTRNGGGSGGNGNSNSNVSNGDDQQQQQSTQQPQQSDRGLHVATTRILLDETVIPKRYARVLLHAIYLDTVDLSLILRSGCGSSAGSLGEVQALTHTGRTRPTPLEEAMELYQIGRFLELDILAQGCEDLILEWLTVETLPQVLKWGNQPYGSGWVQRQACHYLREEFSSIAVSPVLHQLDKTQLINALQSNFLQASELEILQAVLKWGEHELIRRMEDREPNLLSHTAHSVTRKGIKKRDLSDIELREILAELLPLVRMDHVLPPNHDTLNQAIRRGLVSTPPSHMLGGDERENLRINSWIRGGNLNKMHGDLLYVRPRLFMPYYEEIKTLLEDRIATQQMDMLRIRRSRHLPNIPDTLYMVSMLGGTSSHHHNHDDHHHHHHHGTTAGANGENADGLLLAQLPAPDSQTMLAMSKREQKLRLSASCQRALSLPLSSRHEINRQIRLRVVREFYLPDAVADLLETTTTTSSLLLSSSSGSGMGAPTSATNTTNNNNSNCYCVDENQMKQPINLLSSTTTTGAATAGGHPQTTITSLSESSKIKHNSNENLLMMIPTNTQSIMDTEQMPSTSPNRLSPHYPSSNVDLTNSILRNCNRNNSQNFNQSSSYGRNMTFPRQQQQQQQPQPQPFSNYLLHHPIHPIQSHLHPQFHHRQHHQTQQPQPQQLHHSQQHRLQPHHHLPALITERNDNNFNNGIFRLNHSLGGGGVGGGSGLGFGHIDSDNNSYSDGHLSDIMPDVAMATASLGQLQLGLVGGNTSGIPGGGGGLPINHQHQHHHHQQHQHHLNGGGPGHSTLNNVRLNDIGPLNDSNNLLLDLGDGSSHIIGGGTGGMGGGSGSIAANLDIHSIQRHHISLTPPPSSSQSQSAVALAATATAASSSSSSSSNYHYIRRPTSPYVMHRHSPPVVAVVPPPPPPSSSSTSSSSYQSSSVGPPRFL